MSASERTYFPFTAIVGQELLKDALLCNAVQPDIGGVLISGTRGTAKSTAARSLAKLLPQIDVIPDCPFQCDPDQPSEWCTYCTNQYEEHGDSPPPEHVATPFVNLPLGATADRVMGTIDLEKAIDEGERAFEPGLLASANRGVLYIDEVNLLGDHLVDLLLDVAAMGVNRVEREGISFEHRADVILIGTMNPEEGELRPQLLDRFGLYVEMDEQYDPDVRRKVVERRTAFDRDPESMMQEWRDEEEELAGRVRTARKTYDDVGVPETEMDRIVDICAEYRVDGMRADITMHKTARALAALDGRNAVREDDVIRAAELALGHRGQQPPPQRDSPEPNEDPDSGDDGGSPSDPPDSGNENAESPPDESSEPQQESSNDAQGQHEQESLENEEGDEGGESDQVFPAAGGIDPPEHMSASARDRLIERTSGFGRRTEMRTTDRKGYYFRSRPPRGKVTDLALDATIRAAAPYQEQRRKDGRADEGGLHIRPTDYREKERKDRVRNLVVFVVDASGSMGAYERMSAVKGAILSLLEDAYQKRDLVSMIGFRQDGADVLLPPTRSVQRAARELVDLPVGGRTPLAAGLRTALQLVRRERQRRARVLPLLVLLSDGRGNVVRGEQSPERVTGEMADRIRRKGIRSLCIDTEHGFVRMNQVRPLAERMGARYEHLEQIESEAVERMVSREMVEGGLQSWLVD